MSSQPTATAVPGATKMGDVETLDDIRLWIAEFRGRYRERERALEVSMQRIEKRLQDHSSRIASIERKVMWLSGLAAAGGAGVGSVLGQFFGAG